MTCQNCGSLLKQLEECKTKNKELETTNKRLAEEIHSLLQQNNLSLQSPSTGRTSTSVDVENDIKKSTSGQMNASHSSGDDGTPGCQGINLKALQQDLRVSKKGELLAKEKLSSTKKAFEKLEKDFAKYREESEQRIESLKAEIGILQHHYDLPQPSGTYLEALSTEKPLFGAKEKGLSQTADLLKIIDDYSRQNEAKVKELEQLTLKLDKKQTKLRDFKKKHAETESRVAKLKNSLDNVKSFLKLLNTNFIKSMKQQNATLREQILTCEQEFLKEIQGVKNVFGPHQIFVNKQIAMAQTNVTQPTQEQNQATIENQPGFQITQICSSNMDEQFKEKIASQEIIIKCLEEEIKRVKESALQDQSTISALQQNLEKLESQKGKQQKYIANIEALNSQFKEEYKDLSLERDEIRRERDAFSSLINQLKSDYAFRIQSLQSQLEMSRSQAAEPPVQNAQLSTSNEPDQPQFIDADLQNQSSAETQQRKTKKAKKVKKYSSRHSQDPQRNDFEDSSSALDQSQISHGQLNQTGVLEEDVIAIVPPAISQDIQQTQKTCHQQQDEQRKQNESRASSSQGSSFDHQYEGGQEEKKEDQHPNPMAAPIFRPPVPQVRVPLGVGRGRGMPQFRPPVGAPVGFRPPIQQRPPVFNPMQNQAPTKMEGTPQQSNEQPIFNDDSKSLNFENTTARELSSDIKINEKVKSPIQRPAQTQPPLSQIKRQVDNTEKNILPSSQEEMKENISKDETQENKKKNAEIKEETKELAPPTQQLDAKEEPVQPLNSSQEMQKVTQNQNANNAASLLDFRNNRFFGMINGFLTFLTRRKKAYTGRPATAMYYDEKKRRYVIEGEEDSDDDVPPPPPPMKQSRQVDDASMTNSQPQGRKEEEGATSAEALARPAFTGALANRGRGRGRGAPINRFPQTFGANQLTQSSIVPPPLDTAVNDERLISPRPDNLVNQQQTPRQKELKTPRGVIQEENSELYTTTLDAGLNQTQQFEKPNNIINESVNEEDLNNQNPFQESRYEDANDESTIFNANVGRKSQLLNSTMVIQPPQGIVTDQAREDDWLDRFNQQQDKINNLKYKLSMMQQELRNEREQNEQAIEYFTVLCQDLEFKGMDEVEDLQSDISIFKDQLRNLAQEKAYHEIKLSQLTDALAFSEKDNHTLRNEVNELKLKLKLVQVEIDHEISKLSLINTDETVPEVQELQGSLLETDESVVTLKQIIFQQQCDMDNLQYRAAILEAEKLSKSLDIRDLQQQVNIMRGQLANAEANGARLQDDLRRVEEEQKQYGQELVNKLEREKEQIRDMLQKVQSEKERLVEQSRERVNDYESRLKRLESERQRAELDSSRALREKDGIIDSIRNQNLGLNQQVSQAGEEVKWLQSQVRDLQSKVAQLQAKRHSESEQTESLLRAQIKQVQEMLQQREAQAELLATKHEEASLELQQMEAIRHKMTENIIYLQNEIRKRDDLLENSSEFGGDFEMIGDDDVDGDDSSLLVGGADGDDYSNRGGAMSLRGAGEDSQRDTINAAGGDQIGAGASSVRQSFQMVKKQQTKRRTLNHALQNQLEETRQQLKSQIEEKLLTQRKLQNVEHTLRKLVEGFIDVNKILDTQHQQLARITGIEQSSTTGILSSEGEQSLALSSQQDQLAVSTDMFGMTQEQLQQIDASLDQISADESIHTVITKIFGLQRGYESELSDLKHRLKMQQMQIEEADNLKFDIEILTDEKGMLEGEISMLAAQVKDLEIKNVELQRNLAETKTSHEAQLRSLQEEHQQTLAREREEHSTILNQQRAQTQKQIDEIHETFKSQMLPAVKEKYQAKYLKLQEQLKEVTSALTEQVEQEKLQRSQLELQQSSLLNQSQLQIDNYTEENERLKDELKGIKLHYQELQNKMAVMVTTKSSNEQLCASQTQEINQLRQELEESKDSQQRQVKKMVADFDEIAQRLKQKADQKKKELKDFKVKMKVVLQQVQEEAGQKLAEEKAVLEKNLQLALEQAQQQQQDNKSLDDLLVKEESYKARIKELEEKIEAMEILANEKVQQQVAKYEEANRHLQEELAQSIQEKDELTIQIEALTVQLAESVEVRNQRPEVQNEEQLQLINSLQEQLASTKEELQKVNKQLENQSSALQEQIDGKQEEIERRDEVITLKESELQATIEKYTQREEQFKTQTKEVVKELKDKIKKEKEKASDEATKHQAERKQLELQIIELRKQHEYHKGEDIKQLETTIESLRKAVYELQQSTNDKDEQLKQAEEKNMEIANELENAKRNLELCIDKLAEILGEDRINCNIDSLLSKMQEVINNYEEDRRSLRVMIEEKERLVELNEQYLSERESLLQDQQALKQKLEGTGQSTKLEKKVKMLEEERSLMRSDYNLQINSFVQEIDKLKGRLSRYEEVIDAPAEEEEEEEVKDKKEEDHSFGRRPDGENSTINPPSFFDQSKIPKPTDQTTDKGQQQPSAATAQKSGIFNSIASFFLTDSQLENDQEQ